MGRIVVLGEALVDLVISPAGHVDAALGGAPFNTACACGRLGATVSFAGTVSDDRFGSLLVDRLLADGVDVTTVRRCSMPTTLAAAELDERGSATYRFYLAGTSAPAFDGVALPADTTMCFTGGLGLVLEPMADHAAAAFTDLADGVVTMVDVNCRPRVIDDRDRYLERLDRVLAVTDVVKVSDEDLAYLSPDTAPLAAALALLDRGPSVVLLTAGAQAVTVATHAGRRKVPVPEVEVVDTIGAGDSLGGGFASWWELGGHHRDELADLDVLERATRAATVVAAGAVTRRGADPPWRRELPSSWLS